MGSVDGADHGEHFRRQRKRGYLAAIHKGQLPQVPSAHAGRGGGKLLLRLENIHELRPQEYGSESGVDGCRFPRSIQRRDYHADLERSIKRHQPDQGISDRQPHIIG